MNTQGQRIWCGGWEDGNRIIKRGDWYFSEQITDMNDLGCFICEAERAMQVS